MNLSLTCHPDTPCAALQKVHADISYDDQLNVVYRAHGAISDLRIPAHRSTSRADRLWEHTCFELFLKPTGMQTYCEFNFSPSTQWAVYTFTDTRTGMKNTGYEGGLQITQHADEKVLEVAVCIRQNVLPSPFISSPWQANLTAVIEETNGNKSYWALAHPKSDPDFHHPHCFVYELTPKERP